jgi:hypothetical protein
MQQILGVAIGVTTVCLLLSIIASHLQEVLAALISRRAAMLELAIKKMLNDDQLYARLVTHPLIQNISFNPPDTAGTDSKPTKESRPSYIASPLFSKVLLTVLATQHGVKTFDFAALLAVMPDSKLKERFQTLTVGIVDNAAACQTAIETWYDSTMERVNGFYKRRTQWILLGLGLFLAILCNANMFRITSTLWLAKDARDSVTALSRVYGCNGEQPCTMPDYTRVRNDLEEKLNPLPLGYAKEDVLAYWSGRDRQGHPIDFPERLEKTIYTLGGWLLTAVAISLGAPFWFDLLNNLLRLNPRIVGAKPPTALEMRAAIVKTDTP